jgi:hypothetical protein
MLPAGDGTSTWEFVVSSDGQTVTDTITGLVWQRDGSGTRAGCAAGTTCTWAEANAYCASLALGGTAGWRLPARMELLTIVDFTVINPSIYSTAFPNTSAYWFWTSSLLASSSGSAWGVSFYDGNSADIVLSTTIWVRCVR